ncbi:AEC family transporter [Pararhodobacter zhoushanensis]|uniref:AEC family transporter n=1 Tax=Pararhodobacter zhoushanensis TaxID=2479545 RepID=UPI000F8E96E4|nr:AEC family transporter [Pararhodobacter zhoushanensis]
MIQIFLTTLPIYLMIVFGYVAVRSGYLGQGHIGALAQFALKICLPALIVFAVAMPHGEGGLNPSFFLAYMGGSVITLLLGYAAMRLFLRQAAPDSWILALGMANSNSGFLGFPIASLIFGPQGAVVFAMTMTVENAVIIPLVQILTGVSGSNERKLGAVLREALGRIIANPLLIAVALALVWRATGLSMGVPVERAVTALAMAAAPVALFVIGGTVASMSVSGHWRRVSAVSIGKLVVHPLLVAALLFTIPGVPADLIPVGILFAAVPMLTIYPILAAPFGLREVCSTALIVATGLSVVTVTGVLVLLNVL